MMGRLHSFRLLRPTFSMLLFFSIQQTSSAPASEGRVKIPRPLAHAQSRSRALIARHADKQIRYGFDLAERGAVYSAQNEFIDALGTISYVLDAEHEDLGSRGLRCCTFWVVRNIPNGQRYGDPDMVDPHFPDDFLRFGT